MDNRLIITKQKNYIISSFFEGKDMVQINMEQEETETLLGNIYLGKVKNIVKNINAAFVELSGGVMAYLSLNENKNPIFANAKKNTLIQIGDEIIVQVLKENIKTKAPVVTTNLNITGKYVVLTRGKTNLSLSSKIQNEAERKRLKNILLDYQNEEYGIIMRTNAEYAKKEFIQKEISNLISLYDNIRTYGIHKDRFSLLFQAPPGYICDIRDGFSGNLDEIITDDKDIMEEMTVYLTNYQAEDLQKLRFYEDELLSLSSLHGIQTKLEKALQEKVWLKSGGYLVIQPTEALVVIDVNTGKAVAGKKQVQETFFKMNQEAAIEIARQIRLRNLSGIIIVDFIDMESDDNKNELLNELEKLLKKDPTKTVVVDMTALGLVEITRKKVRKPLHEQYKGV